MEAIDAPDALYYYNILLLFLFHFFFFASTVQTNNLFHINQQNEILRKNDCSGIQQVEEQKKEKIKYKFENASNALWARERMIEKKEQQPTTTQIC